MQYEESPTVELKQEINADFKKEIIAFANTEGGEIFVGVDDSGKVLGISNPDMVMTQIGNMIRDGIKPDLTAYTSIEQIKENGLSLVRVHILRGTKRPYHLTDKGMKPSGVFVRHGLSSVPASEEMIRQMIQECDGVAFDKMRCINQELSFVYAENYFKMAGVAFGDNNKRTLKLIDSDGYYTNTALLLSDQCEHSIKCAVYEGTGKTKFKTRKEFSGSILKQLEDAYDFISINNNLNSTIDGLRRTDHPDYPPYAVREALMNAIVHRDYDYSGSTLINIYDDRIEIISLGGLVKGITLKDVMGGISQSRNSILAAVFYRLELIESYGTGIQRIIESYVNAPIKPTFTPNPASFVVTLPQLTSEYTGMDNEDCVLSMINESGYITRKEIECKLGISKAAALDIINRLLEQSKIAKTGSGPNTKYIIRSK